MFLICNVNLNPLHPRMLCAKFGWNWPSGSREEYKNVTTDKGQISIRKAHLSLRLRWTKKNLSRISCWWKNIFRTKIFYSFIISFHGKLTRIRIKNIEITLIWKDKKLFPHQSCARSLTNFENWHCALESKPWKTYLQINKFVTVGVEKRKWLCVCVCWYFFPTSYLFLEKTSYTTQVLELKTCF